jgi:hypothetical protein
MKKIICLALLAAGLSGAVAAQDLALLIEHESVSLGADGVTRIARFSERLVRRDANSWLARVLPPGAHEEADHQAGGKGHKHMDVAAASRWVQLGEDGRLRVRIVDAHEKKVVDVGAPDYANIGFDGRWATASQLLDPQQLKRMAPSKRAAPVGARWYESATPAGAKVQVLWDEQGGYPRRIESRSASGSGRSTMVSTREPMPAVLPWTTLGGYAQKEYSDLLD